MPNSQKRHHLDRRAPAILAANTGDPDELLSTKQLAHRLGVSEQFLEIGRSRGYGYGPDFVRLSPRCIRYRWRDVVAWLEERKSRPAA